jgi:hypothetical protein
VPGSRPRAEVLQPDCSPYLAFRVHSAQRSAYAKKPLELEVAEFLGRSKIRPDKAAEPVRMTWLPRARKTRLVGPDNSLGLMAARRWLGRSAADLVRVCRWPKSFRWCRWSGCPGWSNWLMSRLKIGLRLSVPRTGCNRGGSSGAAFPGFTFCWCDHFSGGIRPFSPPIESRKTGIPVAR